VGGLTMQHARRANPYPWTWEIPAATLTAVLTGLLLGLHLARGLANLAVGGGWQLTPRAQLFTAVPGLLGGDARAGLPAGAAVTATGGQLMVSIVGTEVVLVVGAVAGWRWAGSVGAAAASAAWPHPGTANSSSAGPGSSAPPRCSAPTATPGAGGG
jgi:hypothetical protein